MSNLKKETTMKMMKYVMIGVALMGISATATAQDGTKADIDAVKNIISSKPADMDKQLNNFYKKNKKNAENLIAFSKSPFSVLQNIAIRFSVELRGSFCRPKVAISRPLSYFWVK